VALQERVKLSLEQEQDALRHQACSTAWPCFIRYGVRLAGGRDQRDGDQGTHQLQLFTSTGGKAMAKYASWVSHGPDRQ
jgi:hypothetical protein